MCQGVCFSPTKKLMDRLLAAQKKNKSTNPFLSGIFPPHRLCSLASFQDFHHLKNENRAVRIAKAVYISLFSTQDPEDAAQKQFYKGGSSFGWYHQYKKSFYEVVLLNKLGTCSTTVRNQTCGRWKKSLASPSSRRSFSFAALSYLIAFRVRFFSVVATQLFQRFPLNTHQNPIKSLVCGGKFLKKKKSETPK